MSVSSRAALLGASAAVCHFAVGLPASAQQTQNTGASTPSSLPAIVVETKPTTPKNKKPPASKTSQKPQTNTPKPSNVDPVLAAEPGSADADAERDGSYSGGAGGGGGSGRADLDPNSPTNPMRLSKSSTGHTETITRKHIERLRPRDVFDLVNNAASVIETQGSRKGFSGLRIRGDANFIWLVDGAYIQPTMAARIMRSIPVSIIEEVTVVRGAAALTLAPMVGSASPGGAPVDGFIVVRTRKPKGREAEVRTAVETNRGIQGSVWAGNRFRAGAVEGYVAGAAAHSSSQGPDELLDNDAPYNRFHRNFAGLAKAGFNTAGWDVNLTAYGDDGRFGIPNGNSHFTVGPQGSASWFMSPSRTTLAILSGSKSWSKELTTLFNVSYAESEQQLWTRSNPTLPYARVNNPNYLMHVNLRQNLDLETFRMSLGGDYRKWNAPNGQQYYEGIQREEDTFGGFVEAEKRFFDDRLTIDGAMRFDRVHVLHGLDYYTGGAQPPGGVNSPLRTTDVMLPWAKFYELGTSLRLTDDVKLTGRIGKSEQESSGLQPVPGVTLEADAHLKFEIGAEARISPWFNPAINFFQHAIENEKFVNGYTYRATNGSTQTCRTGPIPQGGPFSPATGVDLTPCYDQRNTTRQGIEFTADGRLWRGGSYKLNWTHFTNLENVEDVTPRNIAGIWLQQRIGDFRFTGTAKYVARYKGSNTDPEPYLGGYTRFDAGIGREFEFDGTSVSATLYGRNLTDRRYETTNGIQDVGRVIGFEVLARF